MCKYVDKKKDQYVHQILDLSGEKNCNATHYGKTECHLNVRSGEHIGL